MRIELISAGSVLATIWLVTWLGLRGSNYLLNPKGEPRAFEPHITRYQDFGKLLIVMATASLAFLINFLINLPSPGSTRNAYSLALEKYSGMAITFLCVSALFTLVFMLTQTYIYEAHCHGGSYPAWLYSLQLAIGYSAVIWFAFAYGYLAYHLIPLIRVGPGAQILTSAVLQPATNGIGLLPLTVASPQT